MKSDKVLSKAELELIKRIQMHFPRGAISERTLREWNSFPEEFLPNWIERCFKVVPPLTIFSTFTYDRRTSGWEPIVDCGFIPALTSAVVLEPVVFIKNDEANVRGGVRGEVILARAAELSAALGQKHAEYLLEHQADIPKELRKFYLVFPGTIWKNDGIRFVPYLRWKDGKWDLLWHSLYDEEYWSIRCRLLRPRR